MSSSLLIFATPMIPHSADAGKALPPPPPLLSFEYQSLVFKSLQGILQCVPWKAITD